MIRSMLEDRRLHHASTTPIPGSPDSGHEVAEDELIQDIAAIAYVAGADTTVSSIVSFFLAMLVNPDVQAKAQAEIDRVIGRERLPNMEDMSSLPYVNAVVTECLRWLPVVPMGKISQHSSTHSVKQTPSIRFTAHDHCRRRIQRVLHTQRHDCSWFSLVCITS
jgi:cytochrome P450